MIVQSYRQPGVWRLAMNLAEACYRATKDFPREELFGPTSRIRRAAPSIPANIAQGQGREHTKEFLDHPSVARGAADGAGAAPDAQPEGRVAGTAGDVESLSAEPTHSRVLSGLRKALGERPGDLDCTSSLASPPTSHHPPTRYYQLTHDYLVPSLRDWLTRTQRETRRGRAELRLAEGADLWEAKRENRHLPSAFESARGSGP